MMQDPPRFVLDACALIAYLNDEEGAEQVQMRLSEAVEQRAFILMSAVNFCEVYYDCLRAKGEQEASRLFEQVQKLPIDILREIDDPLLKEAGRMKVQGKISLADAFALVTAKLMDATMMSSDHHEFDVIEEKGEVKIEWIR